MLDVLKLELFSLISVALVVLALFITHKYVSSDKRKYCYLISTILCILTHYSYFIYQVITNTVTEVPANLYLPEWPCNIMMWLILVVAILNFCKDSIVKTYLLYITSWVGVFCAFFGLCLNTNYLSYPHLDDFNIFKGLLSHVFLLYCCLYPFVEGKAKYNFYRVTLSAIITGVLFIVCGYYTKHVLKLLDREVSGSIFNAPFDSLPWLNFYTMFPVVILMWAIGCAIFECIKYKKGERWFNRLKNIPKELKGEYL